ncbi:MAG TPA: hypothetical protein DEP87_00260 [Candidatus Pacebacteria bacterium]|nr:hypothetical protein [Candidatus Paceibacterota bacterium]
MRLAKILDWLDIARPLALYALVLTGYAFWSLSLTDPNLVYTSWPPYLRLQQWFWQVIFPNRPLLTGLYLGLMGLLWLSLSLIWSTAKNWHFGWRKWSLIWLITCSPLLLANNALSHDVFNYIFNAKMVAVYHVNPHIQVALDFKTDPLTRFMHNTHTPAPYGYGWTFFSLLPFGLSFGKFILAWWWFKWLNVIGTVLLIWLLMRLHQQIFGVKISAQDLVLVIFNPLFVIEFLGNSHNDLWLLMPALAAFYLVQNWLNQVKSPNLTKLLLSLGLLGFSISTKFVTVLLVPIWATCAAWSLPLASKLQHQINHQLKQFETLTGLTFTWQTYWPLLTSFILFAPLFTGRSQQFLPWYWSWVLIWLPFLRLKWWRQVIVAFSLSSLLRYLPWLWAGNYDGPVLTQQRLITWVIPLLWLLIYRGWEQYLYHLKRKT